ncbi:MAG: hypothetical protein ISS25_02980 [Nanoarchaeota archaeon]|nr:hypothetical protein [DPANN group archaeon]MBL7116765.1 hypothetical protein [Nanoarchaeota archaeon]
MNSDKRSLDERLDEARFYSTVNSWERDFDYRKINIFENQSLDEKPEYFALFENNFSITREHEPDVSSERRLELYVWNSESGQLRTVGFARFYIDEEIEEQMRSTIDASNIKGEEVYFEKIEITDKSYLGRHLGSKLAEAAIKYIADNNLTHVVKIEKPSDGEIEDADGYRLLPRFKSAGYQQMEFLPQVSDEQRREAIYFHRP